MSVLLTSKNIHFLFILHLGDGKEGGGDSESVVLLYK